MGAIGQIVNGVLGSNAAQSASGALQSGAKQAQALELTNQNSANAAQQTALSNVTSAEQPYQSLGQTGSNALARAQPLKSIFSFRLVILAGMRP